MNQNKIKLSVIVTVYNDINFITELFHVLEKQILSDTEVVFIDDGSSDGSYEKLLELKQSSVCNNNIIVFKQKNGGPSSARNRGIEICNGEYITFIDADDMIQPDYIKQFYRLILDHTNNDLWITGVNIYSVDGSLYDVQKNSNCQITTNHKILAYLVEDKIKQPFSTWCKIIRKSFLDDNSIRFDISARCMEDGMFYEQCYLNANNIYLSEYVGYSYCRRDVSLTDTYFENIPSIIEKYLSLCCEICNRYGANEFATNWLLNKRKFCFDYQVSKVNKSGLAGKDKKEAVKKAFSSSYEKSDIKALYCGIERILLLISFDTNSNVGYEVLVKVKVFQHFYERVKSFLRRRVLRKQ